MNDSYPTRRIFSLLFLLLACLFSSFSQTLINFDDDDKWVRGSSTISGYATDHAYEDGVFRATGGEASRVTTSLQDGVPKAKGNYAWKLKDITSVDWRITIASGGVGTFSMEIRRWDDDPGPHYLLDYSIDGGTTWIEVVHINNSTLDNSSEWKQFGGTINSSDDEILIRLTPTQGTERVMIDNFQWTHYTANALVGTEKTIVQIWPNPASAFIYGKSDVPLETVQLISIAGHRVKEMHLSGDNEFSLSVGEVKSGVYLLRMIQSSQKESFSRVVVSH